jgi:hypothetical protein
MNRVLPDFNNERKIFLSLLWRFSDLTLAFWKSVSADNSGATAQAISLLTPRSRLNSWMMPLM